MKSVMSQAASRCDLPLRGRRAAILLYSYYPSDPRPRRAAEALVDEGMHVELVCLRQSPDEPARETFGGVSITRVPLARRRGGRFAYVLQYSAFILIAFILLTLRCFTRRYSLIHVHNMPDVLIFAALVPRALGAKVVLDLHDPMPELMMSIFGLDIDNLPVRLLKRLERWSIALADLVITVNLACQRIFTARGCPAAKIDVIMNSPDEKIFTLCSPRSRIGVQRPFVIMYHGSIVERNGLDLAVAALALVRRTIPRAELQIYGAATPFLDVVMCQVRDQALTDAVRYLGATDLHGIVAAIDECDVGIIPNRHTLFTEINTPTRIFEYLARGRPVITGRAAGVADYFGHDSVFYFELGNAEDLSRVIAYIAAHPEDAQQVVKRGQDVYLAHRWGEERRRFVNRIARLFGAGVAAD